MIQYLIQRVLAAIPVMLLVATAVFLLLFLTPGDPAAIILGPDAKPDQVAELRARLGIDQPVYVQLGNWYLRLLRGDLGQSIFENRPVTEAIMSRAEPTLLLTGLATLVAIAVGLTMGVVAALRPGRWQDTGAMVIAIGGVSMPTFWLGLNLIFVFGVLLGWLPVAGYEPLSSGLWQSLRYLILPSITLGLFQAALLARLTRSMMLETLRDDYVRTARAKGLAEHAVILRHAFRNAAIPLLTVIGLIFAALLGGAVITEQVFNIPGVGRMLIQAVARRDYPVVQGVVMIVAGLYVVINLCVDVLYGYLDPRLRVKGS